MKTPIASPHAPAAIGPYSQAVRVKAEEMIFCSGQVGIDPATSKMVEGGIEAQTKQVLANLKAVLTEAGVTFDDVVRSTIFLTDMADFATVNKLYGACFEGQPPARATVAVSALPAGAIVEIDMIAAK